MIEIPTWVFITLLILSSIAMIIIVAIFIATIWGGDEIDRRLP